MSSHISATVCYPSHAELARTLARKCQHGVLATLSDGHPYTSVIEIAPLENGDLLTLLSDIARHSKNLAQDPRASLLLKEDNDAPLEHSRISLKGKLVVAEAGVSVAGVSVAGAYRELYLARHPKAESYFAAHDFKFYTFRVEAAYTIAGFGRMGWSQAQAYRAAQPDPLLSMAPGAIAHMNTDHPDNLVDYARAFLGFGWAETARMLTLDRYGFDIAASNAQEQARGRISFAQPLATAAALRDRMVELADEARTLLEN